MYYVCGAADQPRALHTLGKHSPLSYILILALFSAVGYKWLMGMCVGDLGM